MTSLTRFFIVCIVAFTPWETVMGGDGNNDEMKPVIEVFSGNDWDRVWRTQFAFDVHWKKSIPSLIELLNRDEQVKLENTADLIYPGAKTFYGHGRILNYDIDWLSVRAGWVLEELTFEDFGFSESGIDHDELLNAAVAGMRDVPLREVAQIGVDATTRRKHRTQAIQRAREWWEKNQGHWQRLPSLVAALESDNSKRMQCALQWLRFGESPIDGFSKEVYVTTILPIVKRLAQSSNKAVAEQAALLCSDYDKNEWYWLNGKIEIAQFLATHPFPVSHLIEPYEIDRFLDAERAWALCRSVDGYQNIRESFEIESATVGCVNLLPDSLHVSLRTTSQGPVNGVWWWNPLDENGQPKLNWNDLVRFHAVANQVLSKHPWLAEWRENLFGRTVELHALGDNIAATENELKLFVIPLWRDAGLAGDPKFSVLARRGDSEWVQIYFGTEERRALITTASHPDWKAAHWLDRLDVHFHPKGDRRYVVVEPSGKREVRSFQAHMPCSCR
jgi:hypothetical protein